MEFTNYIKLQIRFIHKFAKHLQITDEKAAYIWGTSNLAAKFSELYK